jgi:hypothetical protein
VLLLLLCFVMNGEKGFCVEKRIKIRFIFTLHVLWLSNEDQYRQLYEWIRFCFYGSIPIILQRPFLCNKSECLNVMEVN